MPTPRGSDQLTRLALQAGRGDREALTDFVRRSQSDVWRFHAHNFSPVEADDLTQETFVRALRSLPRFEARSSAITWLLSIARRTAVDHIRAKSSRPIESRGSDWLSRDETTIDPRRGFTEELALRDAIGSLNYERREAFVLTQMLGYSYDEAAGIAGCPIGTIRSRVARARADLIEHIRDQDNGSGSAVAGS